MTEPAVSVVFRAFNCEKYIGSAIESILGQTFQDFEIVIVDDASTDGTAAIVAAYARRYGRIRVHRNETNQGPVRTMNIGLKQARGEFVAIHDADDVSLPHRLATQVDFLRANPHVAMIGGGAYFIDEAGEVFKVSSGTRKNGVEVRQYLEQGHGFIHTSVMYRRQCLEAIGYYDEFFASSHDYDALVRTADAFEVVYYEEPLVQWRCLSNGVTGTKKRSQAAFARLARLRSQACKEGKPIDLRVEFERLLAKEEESFDLVTGNMPLSGALYYYNIGMMLLKKGKQQQARRRFWQAFRHKGRLHIYLRVLAFLILSFVPGSVHSKPVQVLRRVF